MKNKLLRLGVWILIWVVLSVGFVEYLPQDPHMPGSVLISPVLFPFDLFNAFFYPPELELAFGALFWVIVFVLLYYPRNRKRNRSGPQN